MERRDRGPLATFFSGETPVAGVQLSLDEESARHARVRRLDVGHTVRVVDGAGTTGQGTLVRLAKAHMLVEVLSTESREAPPPVHMLVPVADKERMLWLAEKCAELGAASWRPVLWRRSRNVTPRGEGMTFHSKVRARMIAALEQSGNAWLPTLFPEAPIDRAIAAAPRGARVVLDADGDPMLATETIAPLSIAVGPEGGLEADERALLVDAGWLPVAVGSATLRFETAGIAGLAIARAALGRAPETTSG